MLFISFWVLGALTWILLFENVRQFYMVARESVEALFHKLIETRKKVSCDCTESIIPFTDSFFIVKKGIKRSLS